MAQLGGRFLWIIVIATILAIYYKYSGHGFDSETIRGKRVLITGSSSGIGEELAYQYSKMGASVMITARREDLLKKVAAKCKELGAAKVEYVAADMGKPKDRERLIKETSIKLGGIDHLILNHAIIYMEMWENSPENVTALQKTIEINFVAYADLTSRSMRMLVESNGSIGVVSSTAGKMGGAFTNFYAPSKYALDGFFSGLRQELDFKKINVSITLFILGYVSTDSANTIKERLLPMKNIPEPPVAQTNETALMIIREVHKRSYVVYYPILEWYLVTIAAVIPQWNDDLRVAILPYFVAKPLQP